MKVLLLARSTLFDQPGGDTLQIEQTARYLRKLGCTADVGLLGQNLHVENYDVVHFFNLIRPADVLPYLSRIKKLVVTTIYIKYEEYDGRHRGSKWQRMHAWLGKFGVEYLKTCLRWLKGKDRFPGLYFLLKGQKASIRKVMAKAEYLITASHQEARAVVKDFAEFHSKKYRKINLGSEHFDVKYSSAPRQGVACAARIEGIKNQLGLIRAMKGSPHDLYLYGKAAANQSSYLQKCKKAAGGHVHFEGYKKPDELAELMSRHRIHAMPSFYETTGLATIEALKAGCQAVVTRRGGQEEIFGEHAFYCEPTSAKSISKAISAAMNATDDHIHWVKENFSWERAAAEILDIYREIEARH